MQDAKVFYKRADFYLGVAALVLIFISFANYVANGATQYNGGRLASSIVALGAVSLCLIAVALAFEVLGSYFPVIGKFAGYARILEYTVFVLMLWSFLELIVTETNFIGNMFASVDPIDPVYKANYFTTVLAALAAFVCALVAGLKRRKVTYRAEQAEDPSEEKGSEEVAQ